MIQAFICHLPYDKKDLFGNVKIIRALNNDFDIKNRKVQNSESKTVTNSESIIKTSIIKILKKLLENILTKECNFLHHKYFVRANFENL